MKIFEGFALFAVTTAIFVTSTYAAPLSQEKNDPLVVLGVPIPFLHFVNDGIPKYIQDIKEIIASSNPLETALTKVSDIIPRGGEAESSSNVARNSLENPHQPMLIGVAIQAINVPDAPPETPSALEKVQEIVTDGPIVMGLDPNQPYEEVLDWALKKLGFADTEASNMEDPVLTNPNNPDYTMNHDDSFNNVDDKSDEIVKQNTRSQQILSPNEYEDIERDPQWL